MYYKGFYTKEPDYASVTRALHRLRATSSALRVFSIGQSALGREIYALGFGDLTGATLYVGGIRGTEWMTTLLLCRFAEELEQKLAEGGSIAEIDVPRAFENRSLVLVPSLCPDGVEIVLHGRDGALERAPVVEEVNRGDFGSWHRNANGVDLAQDYTGCVRDIAELKNLGVGALGPTRYGSLLAECQPETQAVARFCIDYDVRKVYTFHMPGEEIYYKAGPNTPMRSQLMAQVLSLSCDYRVLGDEERFAGGLQHWFVEAFGRPGFTVNLGRGKVPMPIHHLESQYEKLRELLMLGLIV